MSDDASCAQRIAIIQAIDAAWERHCQQLMIHVPTGCESLRQVKGGEVMGRLGFNLAVQEVVGVVVGNG